MNSRPSARPLSRLHSLPLVVMPVAVLLVGASAHAEISGFSLIDIEGVGELDKNLDDRLGTTVGATEHFINVEDCDYYGEGEMELKVRISPSPGTGYQYAAAYAPPGKTCSTADANPEAVDGQCYVPVAQEDLTSTEFTFTVEFDKLIGSACDSGDDGDATIYIILQEPTGTSVTNQQIKFRIDLEAPDVPALKSVSGGDGRFQASWTDDVNADDETSYTLYWSDTAFTQDDLDNVSKRKDIDAKSIAIESGLDNGVTYYVGVVAVDDADNESTLSELMEVTPQQTTDFWEQYQQTGGTDPGGFCFIATAAYGSSMQGDLGVLRAFRDEVLLPSAGGKSLVDAYYKYGRRWAAWIADKPALRAVVRVMLVPLVWFARLVLWAGPTGTFALMLLAFALLRHLRRKALAHPTVDIAMASKLPLAASELAHD